MHRMTPQTRRGARIRRSSSRRRPSVPFAGTLGRWVFVLPLAATLAAGIPGLAGAQVRTVIPGVSIASSTNPAAAPRAGVESGRSIQDATRILQEASERYESLEGFCGDFRQTIDVTLLGETKISHGELCWLRPDRFEMRFTDPAGDRIVADGTDLWVYFPSTDPGQAFRTRLAATGGRYDLHREFLSDPGERYAATLEGTEEIDGRPTHVLWLTPRVESPYRSARLWIEPESDLILKLEILEESESVRTVELSDMRLDPDIAQSGFRFEAPDGVQVIRR